MAETILVGNLRTGEILVRAILARSASVTEVVNGAGTIEASVKLPMRDPVTEAVVDLPNLAVPGRAFLAYDVDGEIVNAGPIWSDSFSFDDNMLTLRAAGLWSYWDHRFVLPVLAGGQTASAVVSEWVTSLRTQAKRLVQQAQSWSSGSVPLVLESDVSGSEKRTYPGGELMRVGQALANLTAVDGGPDIAFRPRYKTDRRFIEWVMVTGNPRLVQGGTDHVWDTSVPGTTVRGSALDRDASVLVTDVYETGDTVAGKAIEARVSDPTLPGQGYPILEGAEARSSVKDPEELSAFAVAAAERGRAPEETFRFSARGDLTPTTTSVRAGDMCRIVFGKNWRRPEGRPRYRIMSRTLKLGSNWVEYACFPERAAYPPAPSNDSAWFGDQLRSLAAQAEEDRRRVSGARTIIQAEAELSGLMGVDGAEVYAIETKATFLWVDGSWRRWHQVRTAFTPTWLNWANPGNSTIRAFYAVSAGKAHFELEIVVGSTAGTWGNLGLSWAGAAPVRMTMIGANNAPRGAIAATDVSAGTTFNGFVRSYTTSTAIWLRSLRTDQASGSSQALSAAFTPAVGDIVSAEWSFQLLMN